MTNLIWFRNNLRLNDNPALLAACRDVKHVIPLYVFRQSEKRPSRLLGIERRSIRRSKALLESLASLKKNLNANGSDLIISNSSLEEVFQNIFDKFAVKTVFASIEPGTEEASELQIVKQICDQFGVRFQSIECGGLYEMNQLPWKSHIPNIFSDFRKTVESSLSVSLPLDIPQIPPLPHGIDISGDVSFEALPLDPRSAVPFSFTEETAQEHLQRYTSANGGIRNYKETRNQLLGSGYSTKFSPFLAPGLLSPRTIWHKTLQHEAEFGGNDSTYWVRFELLWREYFRIYAQKNPNAYFLKSGIQKQNTVSVNLDERFWKWTRGETGNPFVDANMVELSTTGFMSNRGRQNVASYLVHRLKQDWRAGAEWFEHHLLDYDPASNWGNWAYLAGVGNDPRARQFNMEKQARQYDANADFMKTWLPQFKNQANEVIFAMCRM